MNRNDLLRLCFASLIVGSAALVLTSAGRAGFRFSHAVHQGKVEIACADCHPKAAESQSGKDDLLPEKDVCLGCHTQDDLVNWGWTGPSRRATGFPKYSHQKHLSMQGVDCARCHGSLVSPSLVGTGKGELGHGVCFACHDGKHATDACEKCHANVRTLRPRDHGVDFLHTHQFTARSSTGACESCHRQSEMCSDCHQGENVLFLTHDRNYLFTHAQDARKHEIDCTSCHDLVTFCNDCHAREGVRPANHDTDWTRGSPPRHAIEARRDIGYCAGCHDEGDPICTHCHQDVTPGKGNDTSIHPSDFDKYNVKGPWHDDDSYYCFDCHRRSRASDGFCSYCHDPERGD